MQDLAPVLIAVCGLSVICVGLILVGGFLLLRFTGGGLLAPLLEGLLNRAADDGDEDVTPRRSAPARAERPSSTSLRGKAQSLDFDEAVRRHKSGSMPAQQNPPRPSLRGRGTANAPLDEDAPSGSLRRSRDREPDIYDEEDEGGFF